MKKSLTPAIIAFLTTLASGLNIHAGVIPVTVSTGVINSGDYSAPGVPYNQQQQYPATSVTDGNLDTGVTTYQYSPSLDGNGNAFNPGYNSSYVQVMYDTPGPVAVSSFDLTFKIFIDGGWFGASVNNNASSPLTASDLTAPTLQITTDGGATWVNVSTSDYSDNYTTQLTGAFGNQVYANNSDNIKTVRFNIDSDIVADGIRLVGPNGGGGNFIGIEEYTATPEPSTYGLLLGGLTVLAFIAGQRRASLMV